MSFLGAANCRTFILMIDLKDAIALLETGNWVSIDYLNYDHKQKKYGHIVRLPRCRISRTQKSNSTPSEINIGDYYSKAQNHSEHFTRNVLTPSGQIRKVHLRLLFQINNTRVL